MRSHVLRCLEPTNRHDGTREVWRSAMLTLLRFLLRKPPSLGSPTIIVSASFWDPALHFFAPELWMTTPPRNSLHTFLTLDQAREAAAAWLLDYNEVRPHSSLGDRTPKEFAEPIPGRIV